MELQIGNVSAITLAENYGTPLYVYDKALILKRIQDLKEAFPNTNICYAVKANGNIELLKIIAEQGVYADCCNVVEMTLAEKAGMDMTKSVFTTVNPTDEDLKKALELGILINLDDISIIDRLLKYGKPDRISFRINPGFGKGKFPGVVVGGAGSKFGMDEETIYKAYQRMKDEGVQHFGLHVMTGCGILDAAYFGRLTKATLEIAKRIEERINIKFEYIDIGGGFGVPYEPEEQHMDIKALGKAIKETFTHSAQLVIEPGRYIIAESGTVLTKITTIKNNFIGLDASMATLLRPALYGAYHPFVLANNMYAEKTQEVDLVGPICESTDFFAKNRAMPQLKEGDILAIQVAGAYSFVMASRYNGQLFPAEVLVEGEQSRVIRKRETVDEVM